MLAFFKPLEWFVTNMYRLDHSDQQLVARPLLYFIILPSSTTYLATSFMTLKYFSSSLSGSKKLIARMFIPLACSAIVTDVSYLVNHSKFSELYQQMQPKYEEKDESLT